MANISSINGNPIVVGASGVEDGSLPNEKLVNGSLLDAVGDARIGVREVYDDAAEAIRGQISDIVSYGTRGTSLGVWDTYVSASVSEIVGSTDYLEIEVGTGEEVLISAVLEATVHPDDYTSLGLRINELSSSDTVLSRTNIADISESINYVTVHSDCTHIRIIPRITKASGAGGGYHELTKYFIVASDGSQTLNPDIEIGAISSLDSRITRLEIGYSQYLTDIEAGGINTTTGENNTSSYVRTAGYVPSEEVDIVRVFGDRPCYIYCYKYDYDSTNETYTYAGVVTNRSDTSVDIEIDKTHTHFRIVAYYADTGISIGLAAFNKVIRMLYEDGVDGSENELPEYWKSYINQKMPDLQELDLAIGRNGVSFVFVTDTHVQNNSLHSPTLIKKIMDSTSVRMVVNGGDWIMLDSSKSTTLSRYRQWNKLMQGMNEVRIRGNHDLNNYNGTNAANQLTVDEFYGIMVRPVESIANTGAKTYYCVDNESQKFRIIVLDSEFVYSSANWDPQMEWLQTKLTEKDSNWTVLVMFHTLYNTTPGNLSTAGTRVIAAINEVYSSMNATLIGILAGHSHFDYNATEDTNGYALIVTNCDTRDGSYSGYDRTTGTTNEQSFDVVHISFDSRTMYFTRIGAGSDRTITY